MTLKYVPESCVVVVSVVVGLVSLKVESECFWTTMVPKVSSVELSASFNTSRKSPISTLLTSVLKVTFISKSPVCVFVSTASTKTVVIQIHKTGDFDTYKCHFQ